MTFVTKPCVYAVSVSDLSNDKKSGLNKLGNASFLNIIQETKKIAKKGKYHKILNVRNAITKSNI